MKQFVLIVLLCIIITISYGVIHNQVTTRISLEYFTVGHVRIVESTSPTILGLAWGIYSNWWIGLILGILLAFAGRMGKWEKRDYKFFFKPLITLSVITAFGAGIAGIIGYNLIESGRMQFFPELYSAIPISGHPSYIAALYMHTASYAVATAGALILALLVFTGRIHEKNNN